MIDAAIAQPAASGRWVVAVGRFFVIVMVLCLGALVLPSISVALVHISAHFDIHLRVAETLYDLPLLAIVIGTPLGGFLADRLGYRVVLLISLAVYCLSSLGEAFSGGFTQLLISRLVLGLAGGALMAIFLTLIATWYEGAARTKALGLAIACSAAVLALVLKLAGSLAENYTWRLPFLIYPLMGLVTLAVAWMAVPRPAPGARPPGASGAILALRRLWPIYLILLLLSVGATAARGQTLGLLKENGITDLMVRIDIVTAWTVAIPIFTALTYVFLRRWVTDPTLLILAASLTGLCLVGAVLPPTLLVGAAVIVTLNLAAGLLMPVASSIVMTEAPEVLRCTFAGLLFSCIVLGQFLGPIVLEPKSDFSIIEEGTR